jgi:hypothetical protein
MSFMIFMPATPLSPGPPFAFFGQSFPHASPQPPTRRGSPA